MLGYHRPEKFENHILIQEMMYLIIGVHIGNVHK